MNLAEFNSLSHEKAVELLMTCCTSSKWANEVAKARPFSTLDHAFQHSDHVWNTCSEPDFIEAFEGHPMIGDVNSLRKKFANTLHLASGEQSSASTADDATLERLRALNLAYVEKFGFIFIVFATGKSAHEMLAILEDRLPSSRDAELHVAAGEQHKITRLRMGKMLSPQGNL